jgi:hypothetical protein
MLPSAFAGRRLGCRAVTDEQDDEPGTGAPPADGAHDEIGVALDGIETDLDEVASVLARMA